MMEDSETPTARGLQRRQVYGGTQTSQKDVDDVCFINKYYRAQERMTGEGARTADGRLSSPPLIVHQRHMPVGTQKFHIPRKTKEKLALFQPLSCKSREYEDMLTILTSGYLDPASSGCFSYSDPRLVHCDGLEKEFVEKRKELKADGRTEKELEESYCFMFVDSQRLQALCERGLFVGHSWITVLGNPQKGVYLSRCSDLLQMNPFTPGASGEIIIFKVIKGKVKSIYENMKNLLDPTPRFDSHLSKNISKVTSVMSYRAYELTQHYFYEYSFDEPRQRPRQVCPYAVVSFQFKHKDAPLTGTPLAPLRSSAPSLERNQEPTQFTVWSGDLVKDDKVLLQVSLRSSSPPFLPQKLPEKLEINCAMSWSQVTRRLPQGIFSYNLYDNSSQEVEQDGLHCSLLEVVDRSRSMTSVTKLLHELESKAVVLVTPLSERGFLFLLSSVQMAFTHERGENWSRSLHALFVFPESRCTKSDSRPVRLEPSTESVSAESVMPGLNHFVPALHFALGKARTNPPLELSAGVEQQAREYINGIKEGVLRPYPMGLYDPELEQAGRQYPVPKLHRLGLESSLRPYFGSPAAHLLQLSRVKAMVLPLCLKLNQARPKEGAEAESTHSQADQRVQQLIDLVLSCKRNAEKELQSEVRSGTKRKRLEQETAQRTIKHLKASQELQHLNAAQHQDAVEPSSPSSLESLFCSVGLKDAESPDGGSELFSKLRSLLTNLNQKATSQNNTEAEWKEASPFDKFALRLGLPTHCDIDLRKQDEFEGGSVSSQEGGFSPSGEPRPAHMDRDPRRRPRTALAPAASEEQPPQPDVPWILIPITGLPPGRNSHRDANPPLDPRLHHLPPTVTTGPAPAVSTTGASDLPEETASFLPIETISSSLTAPSALCSPPQTPDPSPPASPSHCPSPDPSISPTHCPSPEPELAPPASPEQYEAFNDPYGDRRGTVPREDGGVSKGVAEPSPEEPSDAPSTVACSYPAPFSPTALSASNGGGREEVQTQDPESPPLPLPNVDSIVDHHLDSFTSEIQHILQDESICYRAPLSAPRPKRVAQFSPYVSFHVMCPSVQHYLSSLQRQMSSVLIDYANSRTPDMPDTTTPAPAAPATATPALAAPTALTHAATPASATPATGDLADRISQFVASIRAANNDRDAPPEAVAWQTDGEGQAARSPMNYAGDTEQNNDVTSDEENETDGFGDEVGSSSRRQVQITSDHIEVCIRNEPELGDGRRGVGDGGEGVAHRASPSFASNQNTLNSLIDQLQPEVFSNLVEIMKDLKRNMTHFYIHCTEEDDFSIQQIRVHLLKQSFVEKSPVLFLDQEDKSNGKLLVVIKNQDIAAHVHKVPELLSLKQLPSVQFLALDSVEDLRNQSCQELFTSGGQVLADDMVLNPDLMSHEKLLALMSVLENHSSDENLWTWKVHNKAHKKLKEQSRFRRDAASLLEVLMSFHQKQIVDFLPFHKCDMSQGCELLDCAIELQGRYCSYRHTVMLTESRPERSCSGGVMVCGIEEFLRDFRKLFGYNDDNSIPQKATEEPEPAEDSSQSGLVPTEDAVPGSIQLHTDQDFAVLHRAIAQIRAERQQQLRDRMSNGQEATDASTTMTSAPTREQRVLSPPPVSEVAPLRPGHHSPQDLIHSSLHLTEEGGVLPNQTGAQVQTQTGDQDRCPVSFNTAGPRQSPDRPAQTKDGSPTQARLHVETQVPGDQRQTPENRAHVEASPKGDQVQSQVPDDNSRSQKTQIQDQATTESGAPVKTQPSVSQKGGPAPGKSNQAAAPVGPVWLSTTKLNKTDATKQSSHVVVTTPESSRTQRKQKRKPKAKPAQIQPNYLQLAGTYGEELHPQTLYRPSVWGHIAMVRDGPMRRVPPFLPFIQSELAAWTARSRVKRVVQSPQFSSADGWWPTRVTIFEHERWPWALVEKRDERNVTTPVCVLDGRHSVGPGTSRQRRQNYCPGQEQFTEDCFDPNMYF